MARIRAATQCRARHLPFANLIAVCFFAVLASGCTETIRYGRYVDEDKAFRVLVTGTFGLARSFNGSDCGLTEDEIDSGVVDCFSGPPKIATFRIDRVLSGKRLASQVQVVFYPRISSEEVMTTKSYVLALLISDGLHYTLGRRRDLFRTSAGSWALPVMDDYDISLLPCRAAAIEKPIKFSPEARRRTDDYDSNYLATASAEHRITVAEEYFYPISGIELRDLNRLFRTSPNLLNSEDAYDCEE